LKGITLNSYNVHIIKYKAGAEFFKFPRICVSLIYIPFFVQRAEKNSHLMKLITKCITTEIIFAIRRVMSYSTKKTRLQVRTQNTEVTQPKTCIQYAIFFVTNRMENIQIFCILYKQCCTLTHSQMCGCILVIDTNTPRTGQPAG